MPDVFLQWLQSAYIVGVFSVISSCMRISCLQLGIQCSEATKITCKHAQFHITNKKRTRTWNLVHENLDSRWVFQADIRSFSLTFYRLIRIFSLFCCIRSDDLKAPVSSVCNRHSAQSINTVLIWALWNNSSFILSNLWCFSFHNSRSTPQTCTHFSQSLTNFLITYSPFGFWNAAQFYKKVCYR